MPRATASGVAVNVRFRTPNNAGSSASDYDSASGGNPASGSSTFAFWMFPYEANPNGGGAFTTTAMDAQESGVSITLAATNDVRIFQTGVMVLRDNNPPPRVVSGFSAIQGVSTIQF